MLPGLPLISMSLVCCCAPPALCVLSGQAGTGGKIQKRATSRYLKAGAAGRLTFLDNQPVCTRADCLPLTERSLIVTTHALADFLSFSSEPFALLVASFLCSSAMSLFQLNLSSLLLSAKECLAHLDAVGGALRSRLFLPLSAEGRGRGLALSVDAPSVVPMPSGSFSWARHRSVAFSWECHCLWLLAPPGMT